MSGLGHNQCHGAGIIGFPGLAQSLAGLADSGKTLTKPAVENLPFASAASDARLVIGQGAIGMITDGAARSAVSVDQGLAGKFFIRICG